jgi:hypothetical protein
LKKNSDVVDSLKPKETAYVRYEDKTREEVEEDMKRKRKRQFGKLAKIRTY